MSIITGTPLDDLLNGTNNADTIYGLEGSDTINGLQGNDKIVGELEELISSNIAGFITPFVPVAFGGDNLFGDQGNDSLYGDLVTLAFVVETTASSGSQTLGGASIATPIIVAMGSDNLDGGVGNDLLVGDVSDVLLSAKAGSGLSTTTITTLQNIQLNMGVDTLYGGEGEDKLYGDAVNFVIDLQGADNVTVAVSAFVLMKNIVVTYGVDKLYGGNGNDEIYGDGGTFSISIKAGSNGVTGSDAAALLGSDIGFFPGIGTTPAPLPPTAATGPNAAQGLTLTFGADELYGENGDDKIYGDLKTFDLSIISGSNTLGFAPAYADPTPATGNSFNNPPTPGGVVFGDDKLYGGNGNDLLYGDLDSLNVILAAGADGSWNRVQTSQLLKLGADTLDGGNGDDYLYGDVSSILVSAIGGDNSGVTVNGIDHLAQFSGQVRFGQDVLMGGQGDDHLYGDAQFYTLNFVAGDNVTNLFGDVSEYNVSATQFAPQEILPVGNNDNLDGGTGNDFLYGDFEQVNIILKSGDNPVLNINTTNMRSFGDIGGNPQGVVFGSDTINGGDGDDVICGDVKILNMDFQASDNVHNDSTNRSIQGFAGITDPIIFGTDTMDGGDGNDLIYGEGDLWHANLVSGTIASHLNSAAVIQVFTSIGYAPAGNIVQLGTDTITGGSGDDALYGDWKTIDFSFKDGLGTGPGGAAATNEDISSGNCAIKFGNDSIKGGDGTDLLVGDVDTINFQHLDGHGVLITNNILDSNSGVSITWGDDILTGGAGADTFAFTLIPKAGSLVFPGHDTVTDLNLGEGDKLQFKGVSDYAALNAAAGPGVLVNADAGVSANDTVFTFVDGSSLTLLNVDLTAGLTAANTTII